MTITSSPRIALGVMALTIGCASTQGQTAETPRPAPAVAAPAGGGASSALERYVGTYQISPQLTAVIRLQGTRLVRIMNGEQTVLTPISANRFKAGAGEVEFETDQAGRVMMVLRHGSETMRIPRR